MRARNWTAWEMYLPSANAGKRTGNMALCLKPWDHALPEEDAKERMGCKEPLWRTWEGYSSIEKADSAANLLSRVSDERPERVRA